MNLQDAPVALDPDRRPRFSWTLGVASQTAYQLRVSSHPGGSNGAISPWVWDSGRVVSDNSIHVPYGGPLLTAAERYYWSVRVWDSDGVQSPWSDVTSFGIGLQKWSAAPIWAAEGDWAFLRRPFRPRGHVQWATLFVTGRSTEPGRQHVHRLWIDGRLVSVGPSWTTGEETVYQGHDVSELLAGEQDSVIAVLAHTTAEHGVMVQLIVRYLDGRTDVVGSDGSWDALSGTGIMLPAGNVSSGQHELGDFGGGADRYTAPQEHIDLRQWPEGFKEAAFAGTWPSAVVKPPFVGLRPYAAPALVEIAVPPQSIANASGGGYLVDFGRTVVGGVRWQVKANDGDEICISFGEELRPDGTVMAPMRTGNDYRDRWLLRDGVQTLETWGHRVFRFMEVTGVDQPPDQAAFQAVALRHPFDRSAATFRSSSPNLDRVWQFAKNSIEALNLDLYVDSPARERHPYEMDAHLQQKSHLALDSGWPLARHSLEWLLPADRATWPTEWKFHAVLATHAYWMETADLEWLASAYGHLTTKMPDNYLNDVGLVEKAVTTEDLGTDIVDWPPSERDGFLFNRINTVVNCFAYRCYTSMAEMAHALGYEQARTQYAKTAITLRDAINRNLFDEHHGSYRDGASVDHHSVHASAYAVALGVATDRELGPAGRYLAGRGMACSVFTAPYLIEALFAAGHVDKAIELITSDGPRSWLAMMAQGAGSVMEAWHPDLKPNLTFSHPAAASPAFLISRNLLGIRPLAPGYSTFEIAPLIGHLEHVSLNMPTLRGAIKTEVTLTGDTLKLTATVPGGTSAIIRLPLQRRGLMTIAVNGRPVDVHSDGTYVTVSDIGPGHHTIIAPLA